MISDVVVKDIEKSILKLSSYTISEFLEECKRLNIKCCFPGDCINFFTEYVSKQSNLPKSCCLLLTDSNDKIVLIKPNTNTPNKACRVVFDLPQWAPELMRLFLKMKIDPIFYIDPYEILMDLEKKSPSDDTWRGWDSNDYKLFKNLMNDNF